MKKIIIAATAKNNVIGKDGRIPWHSSEEFKHFKSTTINFPIIMGRRTFESLGKPLPGRLNIIISRNENLALPFDDVKIFNSLNRALFYCESEHYEKAFIIGGGTIYFEAMSIADSLIISVMDLEPGGDAFFPQIDPAEWELVNSQKHPGFTVKYYERKL